MNRGRVGEERGGKEMDRCPLTTTHALCDLGTCEIGQVYMATTSNSATEANDVLLDSAATSHMFRKYHVFANYRPPIEDETVLAGNKHPL
jgi:hypothetical protein